MAVHHIHAFDALVDGKLVRTVIQTGPDQLDRIFTDLKALERDRIADPAADESVVKNEAK